MVSKNPVCFELKLYVSEEHKDIVAEVLGEMDVFNFVLGSVHCDLEAEYNPNVNFHEYYDKLVNKTPIIIYSEDREYLLSIQTALLQFLPKIGLQIDNKSFSLGELPDKDWKESWKESFKPIFIKDELAIIPPWENPSEFYQKNVIVIDPGMAFGTGQHETTQLCLESLLQINFLDKVLDVGTGSGILAIAAHKLGAIDIWANDIDVSCIDIAKENSKVNNASKIYFTSEPLSNITENNFSLIIANIQTKPLMTLVPFIKNKLNKNGKIIFSGILMSEKDEFSNYLMTQGIVVEVCQTMRDWCSLTCKYNEF